MVIICRECGNYLLAKGCQKSRTCPYCGSKIPLEKAKKIAYAKKASEAAEMLRVLKEKAAAKHGKAKLQRPF